MVDPANIDTTTPDPAIATGSIDRQKALLNDMIAMEGQSGRQIYERQSPEAQQLLQARLGDAGTQPDARKAVYQAFIQDQTAAEAQHARQIQRQAALNSQFMESAKAAVPIHSKNVDASIDALRLQFEERQRREAEAASARAAASASANVNPLIKAAQQQSEYVAWAKANGKVPNIDEITAADAETFGNAGSRLTLNAVADQLGLDYKRYATENDQADVAAAQSNLDKMIKGEKGDVTFGDMAAYVQDLAQSMELSDATVQLLLAANAPRWGKTPKDALDPNVYGGVHNQYQAVSPQQVQNQDLSFLGSDAGQKSPDQIRVPIPQKQPSTARRFWKNLTGI